MEHRRLRQVVAVLGAAFALRQPNGLMPLSEMVDICREVLGVIQLCMHTGAAFHRETAIELHRHFNPFFGKQIIAHTHVRPDEIPNPQQVRQPCGVHHDVPVVCDKERPVTDIFLYLFPVAQILQFQTRSRFMLQVLQIRKDKQKIRERQQCRRVITRYVFVFLFHLSLFIFLSHKGTINFIFHLSLSPISSNAAFAASRYATISPPVPRSVPPK